MNSVIEENQQSEVEKFDFPAQSTVDLHDSVIRLLPVTCLFCTSWRIRPYVISLLCILNLKGKKNTSILVTCR